jgi:hypothetical protein
VQIVDPYIWFSITGTKNASVKFRPKPNLLGFPTFKDPGPESTLAMPSDLQSVNSAHLVATTDAVLHLDERNQNIAVDLDHEATYKPFNVSDSS